MRSFARIPTGGFSLLLSAALLLMVGGLIASDRALTRASETQARVDAEQTRLALTRALEDAMRSGEAPAMVAGDTLVRWIVEHGPPERTAAALVAGADTVLVVGDRGAFGAEPTHAVPLTGAAGIRWTFVVAHARGVETLRLALWVLSIATMGFLGFAVIRERRQAIRVAERSAELERLYSEVARANTAKSEFLANISHELRTPLNAIVGFVELLKDGVYGDLSPRQVPPVDRIAASATHLRHLVDQVLDIAKIAAGRLEVHAETIVLRAFVLNIASELESLINERGLSLSIAVGASLPRVRTDPTHLRQILVNLIGNAVKYTPAGGRVDVGVRAEDGRAILTVADTGAGIPADELPRIWDRLFRGDTSRTERGLGLGLSLVKAVVEAHGGTVEVQSEPGKGTELTVTLPAG